MKEVTVEELNSMMKDQEEFVFIDVREEHEYEWANLGAKLIPMGEFMDQVDEIPKDKKVIIHCKSGARSGTIVQALDRMGYENIYNLKGGILAWINQIDPSLPQG